MRHLLCLLILSLISCGNNDAEVSLDINGLIYHDLSYEVPLIKEKIAVQMSDSLLINDREVMNFHKITRNYCDYLDSVMEELISNIPEEDQADYSGSALAKANISDDYLFDGDSISIQGKRFIDHKKQYRNQILEMTADSLSNEHIILALPTDDIQRWKSGKKVFYLKYYFKDVPLITVLLRMKLLQKQVLLAESEYLYRKKIELLLAN